MKTPDHVVVPPIIVTCPDANYNIKNKNKNKRKNKRKRVVYRERARVGNTKRKLGTF